MVLFKPKRPLAPVHFLHPTIFEFLNVTDDIALVKALENFSAPYHFERSEERNLANWYKILNRFDQLLDRYVSEYDILGNTSKSPEKANNTTSTKASTSTPSSHNHSSITPSSRAAATLSNHQPKASSSQTPKLSSTSSSQPTEENGTADSKTQPSIFTPSPRSVRLILLKTRQLIQNSSHDSRHVYNSMEPLTALLADGNASIVLLSLEILHLLYQKSNKFRTTRVGVTSDLIQRLNDISIDYGGRERGMGLVECCSKTSEQSLPVDGQHLHFKFTTNSSSTSSSPDFQMVDKPPPDWASIVQEPRWRKSSGGPNTNKSTSSVPLPLLPSDSDRASHPSSKPSVSVTGSTTSIVLENASSFDGDERWLLSDFASKHRIPKNKLFSFLYAYRRARAFGKGRWGRIEGCILRMHALTILFLLQPMQAVGQDHAKENELLQDVVSLARAEKKDGLQDIPSDLRSIAIRFLIAFSFDRHRLKGVLAATGLGVHHGAMTTLLRSEVRSILDEPETRDSSPVTRDKSSSSNFELACNNKGSVEEGSRGTSCGPGPNSVGPSFLKSEAEHLQVTESLLALVHSLAVPTSASGNTSFTTSGILSILIPLISDTNASHCRVVTRAVRAMQAIMEGGTHSSAIEVFREQNGLTLIAERIATEVGIRDSDMTDIDTAAEDEKVETLALQKRGETRSFYQSLGKRQMTHVEALEHHPPSSSATSRGQLPHSKWGLLRSLHQLLIPALGTGGSEVRELVTNIKMQRAMRKIMGQPFYYGGSLFQSAASAITNIAHTEPTGTSELVKAGIAATVLRSTELGLPPCGEAIKCVPNLLAALCLSQNGRDVIIAARPLKSYLLRLATPFYTRALHGDIPVHIGNGLDELVRHVESLRPDGNEAIAEYLRISACFVDSEEEEGSDTRRTHELSRKVRKAGVAPLSVDSESKSATKNVAVEGDGSKSSPEMVLLDKMKLAVSNNACRLAGMSQNSTEHQEGLVKGSGLQDMIRMRKSAALSCAEAAIRDGQNFSRHYPTPSTTLASLVESLRSISSRHPSSVLKVVFAVILEDAAKVLEIAKKLGHVWLPEEERAAGNSESDSKMKEDADKDRKRRAALREKMKTGVKLLRVDVVLLSGLLRRPLASSPSWSSCGGAEVAATISFVERAARFHLASVYTGLVYRAPEGDLTTASVTAAAKPSMKPLEASMCYRYLGNIDKLLGVSVMKSKPFEDACKKFAVPPTGKSFGRQKVKGLAWHLVTFAVAVQNLYSTLAKGLTYNSHRSTRDPIRYAACAKSLSATIARIFVLHLKAAESLWNVRAATMRETGVLAAWDYIRGVLIEIKGTVFEEQRRGTQSMILKSFFEAGGLQVLLTATRPLELAKIASRGVPTHPASSPPSPQLPTHLELREKLYARTGDDPISTSSHILAIAHALPQIPTSNQTISSTSQTPPSARPVEKVDMEISSDSMPNDAKPISTATVIDSPTAADLRSKSFDEMLSSLLRDEAALAPLRIQVQELGARFYHAYVHISVRKVASDVWNSLCGFLLTLGSCPGLNIVEASVTEAPNAMLEWSNKDIQRTALTATLRMLHDVTRSPPDFLSVLRQDESASADIVALLHTATNLLKQFSDPVDVNANYDDTPLDYDGPPPEDLPTNDPVSRDEDGVPIHYDGPPPDDPSPNDPLQDDAPPIDLPERNTPSPDPNVLQSLMEMGFSERLSRTAIRRTAPGGVQHATEWLISHLNGEEDSMGSDGERDWDGEEQASPEEPDQETGANVDREVEEQEDGEQSPDMQQSDSIPVQQSSDGQEASTSRSPTDEVMIDPGQEPAEGSENENSNRGSSPSIVSKEGDQGSAGSELERSNMESPKSQVIKLNIEEHSADLLQRTIKTEFSLLRAGLRKSGKFDASEITAIFEFAENCISAPLVDLGDEPSSNTEASKIRISPTSVESFNGVKEELFASLVEVTHMVVNHAKNGREDLAFLCIELLSILQKDGILSEQHRKEFAILLRDGLLLAQSKNRQVDIFAVGRIASLWVHYGGYRARQSLHESGVFALAFKTLRKLIHDWEALVKEPCVDKEATQPIKQLSIKEENIRGNRTNSATRKRRHDDDGNQELFFAPRGRLATELPKSPSTQQQSLLRSMTVCMLLLDGKYRYEFKDNLILFSKKAKESKTKEKTDKKQTSNEKDKMETEDSKAVAADDNELNFSAAFKSFEERVIQEGISDQIQDIRGRANDVDMKSPAADESGANQQSDEIAAAVEELSRIKALALEKKKKVIEKTKRAIKEMVPEVELDESQAAQRVSVFQMCVRCLQLWRSLIAGDSLIASLQLIAALTRNWSVAERAYEMGAVSILLSLPQLDNRNLYGTDYKVVRTLVRTILRHIVEDPKTLEEAMVGEIQALVSQPRSRTRTTARSLLTASAPMLGRNLNCFVSAASRAVKATDMITGSRLQLQDSRTATTKDVSEHLPERSNVKEVIEGFSRLLVSNSRREMSSSRSVSSSFALNSNNDMQHFALESLAELTQLFQIGAVAFLSTKSPLKSVGGSALDYVIQACLPFESSNSRFEGSPGINEFLSSCGDSAEGPAKRLLHALCSLSANMHKEAVEALAKATRMEAEKDVVNLDAIRGIANCINNSETKLRVLKVMLNTNLPNDLARSLKKMDTSGSKHVEVTASVLRTLALLGQAARYIARTGDFGSDEISFFRTRRSWWEELNPVSHLLS